jgi:hypothetical protein
MGLWVEQAGIRARKERITKLGPARDAAPEIARIREAVKTQAPSYRDDNDAAYKAFEERAIALMSQWGANDQTRGMTAEAAVAWVRAHKRQVRTSSSAYRWQLACFDDDDFGSEAVVSALEAAEISTRKGTPFEGIFWTGYKYRIEHLCNGSQVAERFLEGEDRNREDNRFGSMDSSPDSQIEKACREMFHRAQQCTSFIHQATWIMSAEQAEAWMLLMSEARPTTQEVGDMLELTRQGAEYRLKQGWKKVRKFYRELGITFDADTGEITSGHKLLVGVDVADVEIDETEQAPSRKRRPKTAGRNRRE